MGEPVLVTAKESNFDTNSRRGGGDGRSLEGQGSGIYPTLNPEATKEPFKKVLNKFKYLKNNLYCSWCNL